MSSLSSTSINRPVLAIVMAIVIVLFGIIGFNFLGVREYPSVDPPIVTVSTSYTGASANIIETQITEPLEESINGIAGIKSLTSVSREGRSTVTVEFQLDMDLENAANDVRDKVSRAVSNIPDDADPPVISKADADRSPIIFMGLESDQRSLLELSDIALNQFKERFQTIQGVSEVDIWGDKRYSMRLWMDTDQLSAYGLTPIDVIDAVNSSNVELPSGRVEGQNTELTVRTMGRLNDPEEFNNLIVKEEGDRIVRFKDVGNAELGPENQRTILKRDGTPMVGVVLRPQPGANNVEIAEEFYSRLEQIKPDLPPDLTTNIGFDTTRYIKESIAEVEQTVFIAFILVVIIIFAFLRDWRTSVIPILTIPIALIGTFSIMYFAGFSINVLTMLGIVLAIGLVVDDTIVVLENIYTKIEEGIPPKEAGMEGAKEIFFAVISTTVALASVFLPVIFLQGITGRLFREFGFVIMGAVIISSFVALSLAPMLCSKILKKRSIKPWIYRKTEPFFQWLNKKYNRSLENFMQQRWWAFVIIIAMAGGIYLLGSNIPSELAPLEDRNDFRVFVTGPEGSTFEYMDNYMDRLINLVEEEVPELEGVITVTSPGFGASSSVNSGFLRAILSDATERERSQQEIAEAITPKIKNLTGARAIVSQPQTISSDFGGLPVQYVIQATDIEKLKQVLPEFTDQARNSAKFSFVDVNLKFNKPELQLTVDRNKARSMGVSVRDVARTLQLALSGQRFGYFIMNGRQYQVIGQVERSERNEPVDLQSIYVKNQSGQLLQLDNFVSFSEESTPPQLFRYDRYSSATVSAGLAGNTTLGEGIEEMERISGNVLDETYTTTLAGNSKEFRESSSNLLFAFLFAIILIYLVLSAQFESFRDPFIIMFTVPLALAGALFSIWYFNETLNIFSQIGIIMLVGLVTKNGILIVEFANQRKAKDMSIEDSIIGAAEARFRPILMTSLSTVLGILPIALALGAGSESRVSMGIAVIGGLIFSTILTLYVIPAVYTYFTSETKRLVRT